jgi:hypothetical protein
MVVGGDSDQIRCSVHVAPRILTLAGTPAGSELRQPGAGVALAAARRADIREHQAAAGQARLPGTGTLVVINGPEGVGKTATAFELNRRLPGSTVCDPNHVGSDRMSVAQVADTIAGSAGLAITPSADGPVRAWMHRYATTVREQTPW